MKIEVYREYRLSICIPNYNRIDRLERLLKILINQIVNAGLEEQIELCVSDDCSIEDPIDIVKQAKKNFPKIEINYKRNDENRGMDYNFLGSVLMAKGKYAWIIGNDDVPEEKALSRILGILEEEKYRDIDFIVTPFDSFDYYNNFVETVYPLGNEVRGAILFDTSDKEQLHDLIMQIKGNTALFGFLSNVIFKRKHWLEHGDMFKDKMSSIFIQVYMNMQTLMEGAKYLYIPEKIILNYLDDETNQTMDRAYKIAVGLYDAMDYFFQSREREYIEKNVVDVFIASKFMELSEDDVRKVKIDNLISERIDILKQYYVRCRDREKYFYNKLVIVYGAGKLGHRAVDDLLRCKVEIIGICDIDEEKQGGTIQGKIIFNFDRLLAEYRKLSNCIVVVANHVHLVQIINKLQENSILRIAIIT